ncbi:MAG: hypothetical protein Q4A65_09340 [Bacillota bacterium]|nr:hypothetical protein [Bacillota bacterium]
MLDKLDIIVANPAGNTTIFILSPVPVSEYQKYADFVLDIDFKHGYNINFTEGNYDKEIKGEQVGFIVSDNTMNMSGLEFCGNASRAFAYYEATKALPAKKEIDVNVSGCSHPLHAWIDADNQDAKIQMPLPVKSIRLSSEQLGVAEECPELGSSVLVDLDGISHLVLKNVPAEEQLFNKIKDAVYAIDEDIPALGVMFIDEATDTMTPVVYVKDVNTTYFEGSCASGTSAAAFVKSMDLPDGIHKMTFKEPAGTLYTEITKESGEVTEIRLNGLVELSDVITLDL